MDFGRLITAMVTPMHDDGRLDLDAAAALTDHLIATGSESIVVAGTTGESPTLTTEEKLALFRTVRDAAAGRACASSTATPSCCWPPAARRWRRGAATSSRSSRSRRPCPG